MKKSRTAVVMVLFITLIVVLVTAHQNNTNWEYRYYEHLDNATYQVVANEINVRSGPGTNFDIVSSLTQGDIVVTSGKTYEPENIRLDNGHIVDYWVELDNGNWVVNWSLTGGRLD